MNPKCFFDIEITGEGAEREIEGRIEFELRKDIAPKTAENFRVFCTGEKPDIGSYKNTKFHRIIPGFMLQGGDYENNNGTGGESIYGGKFEDENFTLEHNEEGILAMANSGHNTNGSQFFIATGKNEWLNKKHVVFGKVTKGMDLVKKMDKCGDKSGTPLKTVKIIECGQLYDD